ncbi:MAG: peptidase [Acidimicrobiales bacterium]|nr:peptidase [Acidimicrobiales bacterium]
MTDTTERPGDLPPLPPRPPQGDPRSARRPRDEPAAHAGLRLAGLIGVLLLVGITRPWMLLVIAALVLMIFLHELGHYLMAKRAGMKVTEFFLGFGPKLWSTRRGETEYGIKLIPAGAYVKIIGMHSLDEVAPEDEARTYRQKTFGQRFAVAVAGSTMHFLLALGLIFISLVAVGAPGGTINPTALERNWVVGSVVPGSGAEAAGIRAGDKVVSIGGKPVGTFNDMALIVLPLKGKRVPVVYERKGVKYTTMAALRPFSDELDVAQAEQQRAKISDPVARAKITPETNGCCFGVGQSAAPTKRLNALSGVVAAPREFVDIARLSFSGLGRFFSPSGISNFASQVASANKDKAASTQGRLSHGPVTPAGRAAQQSRGSNRIVSIVGIVQIGSSVSAAALLDLFVLVNISIGIINLAPLLPFDGGHVVVAIYEKVQEKRLRRRRYFTDMARLMPLTYAVVLLLGLLFVTSIYLDFANPLVSG